VYAKKWIFLANELRNLLTLSERSNPNFLLFNFDLLASRKTRSSSVWASSLFHYSKRALPGIAPKHN
jgi:hypothetical protein